MATTVCFNAWVKGEVADMRLECCGSSPVSWQGDAAKTSLQIQDYEVCQPLVTVEWHGGTEASSWWAELICFLTSNQGHTFMGIIFKKSSESLVLHIY